MLRNVLDVIHLILVYVNYMINIVCVIVKIVKENNIVWVVIACINMVIYVKRIIAQYFEIYIKLIINYV